MPHHMSCHYWRLNDPFRCMPLLTKKWSLLLRTQQQRLPMFSPQTFRTSRTFGTTIYGCNVSVFPLLQLLTHRITFTYKKAVAHYSIKSNHESTLKRCNVRPNDWQFQDKIFSCLVVVWHWNPFVTQEIKLTIGLVMFQANLQNMCICMLTL